MKALENIKEIERNAIMIVGTLDSENDSVLIPMSKSRFDRLVNEAIAELEAMSPTLMSESKTCESCKHLQNYHEDNEISCDKHFCFYPKNSYCKYWEKKR